MRGGDRPRPTVTGSTSSRCRPSSDATRFTADYDEFLQFKDEFYAQVP